MLSSLGAFVIAASILGGSVGLAAAEPDRPALVPSDPTSFTDGAQTSRDALEIFSQGTKPGRPPLVVIFDQDGAPIKRPEYVSRDAIGNCGTRFVAWYDPCDIYADPVEGEPTVTLNDLATVRPAAPTVVSDPAGVGLVNAPANVVATASEQQIGTRLFDRDVQVRFVPVQYTFSYGDGASRSADNGGATWADLGVAQFTPTDTSHAYASRGTFGLRVTVAYVPFVNFGPGWRLVAGTVSATSGEYPIQIVEARTALVERDCNEDPSGVGCPAG